MKHWHIFGMVLLPLLTAALAVHDLWRQPRALTAAGLAALEAGDATAALAPLRAAVDAQAISTTLKNLALAALMAGDERLARESADRLAAQGGQQELAWRDFLRANLAWEASLRAETRAHGPMPPAGSLEQAIALAASAQEGWRQALARVAPWPAAAHNLELAARRLEALEQEAAAAATDSTASPTPTSPAANPPPLSAEERQGMMQEMKRLDRQRQERLPTPPPPAEGIDW